MWKCGFSGSDALATSQVKNREMSTMNAFGYNGASLSGRAHFWCWLAGNGMKHE